MSCYINIRCNNVDLSTRSRSSFLYKVFDEVCNVPFDKGWVEFDPEKDTILNSVYQQAKQSQMMGGDMMNGMVDDMGGEQPITGEEEENPFEKALIDYLHKGLKEGWNE